MLTISICQKKTKSVTGIGVTATIMITIKTTVMTRTTSSLRHSRLVVIPFSPISDAGD